jgi:hypothetical protein
MWLRESRPRNLEQPPTEAKTERGRIKLDGLFQIANVDVDHYPQSRRLCYDAQQVVADLHVAVHSVGGLNAALQSVFTPV